MWTSNFIPGVASYTGLEPRFMVQFKQEPRIHNTILFALFDGLLFLLSSNTVGQFQLVMSHLSIENLLKCLSWSVSSACKLLNSYLFDWKFAWDACDSRAALWKPQYYATSLFKMSVYFWNRLTKLCQGDQNKEGERLEIQQAGWNTYFLSE